MKKMHHRRSTALPITLLSLLPELRSFPPTASALEDTLRAFPAPSNHILYEGYYSSLTDLGAVRVVSNVPVNYQRYHDDQFLVGQAPLSRGEAKVVVSSDCSTSETNVVPNVSWESDAAESPLVTLTVDVPLAEEQDPSLMSYLDPGFYEAFWNYTSYWCVVFSSYWPTTDPTPAPQFQDVGGTTEEVPCMTREECAVRRQELGFSSFYVDASYPSKGCFSKNDKAFFGLGGTDEEMGEADLPGLQERIWCERLVKGIPELEDVPTLSPTASDGDGEGESVCLTEEECNARRKELGFKTFYVDASYPSKGCFSKNDRAFFGEGGTVEQMSDPDLAGVQQRIWCQGGSVPVPLTKSQSQSNALGHGDGSNIISYPEASVSLVEKAEEETTATTLGTSASTSLGNASRFCISIRLVTVAFMVIWMLSILCSELGSVFGGFGKFSVMALAVSAAMIYPQHKNEQKSSLSSHQFARQTRSLQPSCSYNVEVLMDGCRSVEIISQAPARVVNVSFLNYTEKLNEEDDCITEYSANLTFPVTSDTEELEFTPEGTARVASYPEEMCIQIVEGRPFVDDSGSALKAAPIVSRDDSWSSLDDENNHVTEVEENQYYHDNKNNVTSDRNYLRLGEEWTQRALSEHSSVASFSAFSIALMTNEAPSSLVEDALKAGLDEIRHAKVSFRIATSLLSNVGQMMLIFYTSFIKHIHSFLESPINILGITGFADQ